MKPVLDCMLLVTALSLSGIACAEEETLETPEWSVTASAALSNDSVFRGQSQTWGKPALMMLIEAQQKSGLYAGLATANVSGHWYPGAHIEVDYYGGYRSQLPGAASKFAYDVGVIYYTYPGGANWSKSDFAGYNNRNSLNTVEAYVSFSRDWLTFKTGRTLTEYWGWSTNNSPVGGGFAGDMNAGVTGNTRGSYYVELDGIHDLDEHWAITGQLGRQYIHHATGLDISYYKLGLNRTFTHGWSIQSAYSWTSEPDAYKNFISVHNGSHAHPSDSDIARKTLLFSLVKTF